MSVLVRHVVDVLAVVAVLADVQKHQTLEFSDSSIPLLDLRPLLLCGVVQAREHDREIGLANV